MRHLAQARKSMIPNRGYGFRARAVARPRRQALCACAGNDGGGFCRERQSLPVRFQSAAPVLAFDPVAFFIHHAGLEHGRGAGPMQIDPGFDPALRHVAVAAEAGGDLARQRFDVGSHRRSVRLFETGYHTPLFVRFATAPGVDGRGPAPQLVVTRLDRVTQYAEASRFITAASGMLDRPVEPGDDSSVWRAWRAARPAELVVTRRLSPT